MLTEERQELLEEIVEFKREALAAEKLRGSLDELGEYLSEKEQEDACVSVIDTLGDRLADLRARRRYYEKKNLDTPDPMFKLFAVCADEQLKTIEQNLKRWTWKLTRLRGEEPAARSFDLERIKSEVEIAALMPTPYRKRYASRALYLCPFHSEDTPSFTVYEKQNSWFCYGCGKGGSVVDLYMALNGLEFTAACKEMQKLLT